MSYDYYQLVQNTDKLISQTQLIYSVNIALFCVFVCVLVYIVFRSVKR